ncbi:MAG: glycoside hydrolase family 127 protein [Calditrichaeota bacterium]|nr:MAG: glycoside hydrolase family 127 protein [Calditrichota bacterium]
MIKRIIILILSSILIQCNSEKNSGKNYAIQPIKFSEVEITDNFWAHRIETNRKVTIPFDIKKSEETGRINNFAIAAGLKKGAFEGIRYNDSDVYKIMEGIAYSLSGHPDPRLEKYMDDLIEIIAAAQEDDGYLYTQRTIDSTIMEKNAGDKRWSYLPHSHELYNVGHMYEAAVAWFDATGKRSLLDVAIKNADFLLTVFGPGKKHDIPGHQEIEIGLAKLYRVTGKKEYLDLAKFFLDERGNATHRELYGDYCQDHKPVIEQTNAVGHAVRALYMYSGMADVAALTGDAAYIRALDRIWQNMVMKRMYVTGGVGARRSGEAFGDDYELPNDTAYNETCAAIANMMWNHRLFLLHGHAKYFDVLERTLYNGYLVGTSLEGNLFFYPNPLHSDGKTAFNRGTAERQPWFDCSCCPVNVVRTMPAIPGYIYAQNDQSIFINLFISSNVRMKISGNNVAIQQKSDYPWNGDIEITVDPEKTSEFELKIRIPVWARGNPVPGDLYTFLNEKSEQVTLQINGTDFPLQLNEGYAIVHRKWQKRDRVKLILPMPVQRILAHENVTADRWKMALQRGPVVYCVEGADNDGQVLNMSLADETTFQIKFEKEKLGGIVELIGEAISFDGKSKQSKNITAIPYFAWNHRGPNEMRVWIPRIMTIVDQEN